MNTAPEASSVGRLRIVAFEAADDSPGAVIEIPRGQIGYRLNYRWRDPIVLDGGLVRFPTDFVDSVEITIKAHYDKETRACLSFFYPEETTPT